MTDNQLEFIKFPHEESVLGLQLTFLINREAGFTMWMMHKYISRAGHLYRTYDGGAGSHVTILEYPTVIIYKGKMPRYGPTYISKPYLDKELGYKKSLERMIRQVKTYAEHSHIKFSRKEIAQIRKFYREEIKKWRNE